MMTNNPVASTPNPPFRFNGLNGFLSLAGFLSALALPVMLVFLGGDTVTRKGATGAYIGSVIVLFGLFLLLFPAGLWLRKRAGEPADSISAAYVTLIVPVNSILIALTVTIHISLTEYLFGVLIIHLLFFPTWWFSRKRLMRSALFGRLNEWGIRLLPIFYGVIFWGWFCRQYQPKFGLRSIFVLLFLVTAYTVFARSEWLQNFRLRLRKHWWIYILVVLFLLGLIFQPALPFNRSHSNPLLASMLDVRNGKWIFVDTLSQYGVGVIYFLLSIFYLFRLPVSYSGLAVVINALYFIQFAALFLILNKATRSFFLSLAGIGAILYFNYFAVAWPSILRIPAQGPLRYGLTYLLLGVAWIGMNRPEKRWWIVELALLGIASVWSLEVFLLAFVPLNAVHFCGEVLFSPQRKTGLIAFGKRLLMQFGTVILCWGAWWAATLRATGQPPNLAYYLDVFITFTSLSAGGTRVDFHAFWAGVVAAIYLGTILAVMFAGWRRMERLPVETAALLAGLSAVGLLQYLYYFVYDIDFHLSLLCVPLIMVIVLWISITQNPFSARGIPRINRWIFGTVVVISMWFAMAQTISWFYSGVRNSFLFQAADTLSGEPLSITDPYRMEPSNHAVSALMDLTERYASDDRAIAVFAHPDDQTELLLLTGKTHLLDMTDPVMCTVSLSFSAHVRDLAERFAGVPDYIFYDSSEGVLLDLQKEAFRILTSGASYSVVDRIGNILVYRRG